MTTPRETLWEMDPHTKAKHEILQRYLKAWFPILNMYNQRIVYVDGFSGPGRYKGGQPGSPIITLDVAINHRKAMAGELVFWFIDERRDRVDHLQQELAGITIPGHFKVTADCGRFDEKLRELLDSLDAQGSQLAPTFAFIDPFGFSGIPFALIERLLKRPKCEAFITFMVDAINRFLEHPKDNVVRHIVETFGTEEAIRIAEGAGDRVANLRKLYQSQLQKVARFVRYFEMRDRQDRTQYYLFFATNHELGHVKMKEAMWRVDPDGAFRFSDATNPNQLVLFEQDTTPNLVVELRRRFQGKGEVTGLAVLRFVENETAYLKKHLTAALKAEEAGGRLKVEATKVGGEKRKKNTYPDDARMTFP